MFLTQNHFWVPNLLLWHRSLSPLLFPCMDFSRLQKSNYAKTFNTCTSFYKLKTNSCKFQGIGLNSHLTCQMALFIKWGTSLKHFSITTVCNLCWEPLSFSLVSGLSSPSNQGHESKGFKGTPKKRISLVPLTLCSAPYIPEDFQVIKDCKLLQILPACL